MKAMEERIAEVLSSQFKIDRDVIDSDVTFAQLNIDSLIIIELGLLLDSEFDVAIEDGELTDFMTIADTADLIAGKQAMVL